MDAYSVPDSVRFDSIAVYMSGYLGNTTAFSLAEIWYEKRDTVFHFAAIARQVEETGKTYEFKDITFDTTIVLTASTFDRGRRYFQMSGSNGIFLDTSIVY
ncbi:MAG: hypothetical protein WD295_03905 [Bacteroidota bacterium]